MEKPCNVKSQRDGQTGLEGRGRERVGGGGRGFIIGFECR